MIATYTPEDPKQFRQFLASYLEGRSIEEIHVTVQPRKPKGVLFTIRIPEGESGKLIDLGEAWAGWKIKNQLLKTIHDIT